MYIINLAPTMHWLRRTHGSMLAVSSTSHGVGCVNSWMRCRTGRHCGHGIALQSPDPLIPAFWSASHFDWSWRWTVQRILKDFSLSPRLGPCCGQWEYSTGKGAMACLDHHWNGESARLFKRLLGRAKLLIAPRAGSWIWKSLVVGSLMWSQGWMIS